MVVYEQFTSVTCVMQEGSASYSFSFSFITALFRATTYEGLRGKVDQSTQCFFAILKSQSLCHTINSSSHYLNISPCNNDWHPHRISIELIRSLASASVKSFNCHTAQYTFIHRLLHNVRVSHHNLHSQSPHWWSRSK